MRDTTWVSSLSGSRRAPLEFAGICSIEENIMTSHLTTTEAESTRGASHTPGTTHTGGERHMRHADIGTCFDSRGQPLAGAKTYMITLPPQIPASVFWSFTVYDAQTRSVLHTNQEFPHAGSRNFPVAAALPDRDGSTTIFFGPRRPPGVPEGNWIETVPGRDWWVILRLYGPTRPFFEGSWRCGEIRELQGSN
jgi:Protein of unknown function (DUF1214)